MITSPIIGKNKSNPDIDVDSIENCNPNKPLTKRRSTRNSHKGLEKQPTLDEFCKKRQRESLSTSPKRNVKPKSDPPKILSKTPEKNEDVIYPTVEINGNCSNVENIIKESECVNVNGDHVIKSENVNGDHEIKSENVNGEHEMKHVNGDHEVKEDVQEDKNQNTGVKTEIEVSQEAIQAVEIERCFICNQNLRDPDLKFYYGHPQNAIEEYVALTDENLVVSSGDDGDIMERPQVNITGYSVYDTEGHLCPIDGGLIESDVCIYMSGYLKSICSESSKIDSESVPVKDLGPIVEWSIHGFDGGQNNCIMISTQFGEYNLLTPSAEYSHLMDNLYERIRMSKVVIEYLEEFSYLMPTYEDLLSVIKESTIPELDNKVMTEEMLHKHAKFVCDQVVSLEIEDEDDPPLITLPCMRELVKLFGIKFGKTKFKNKINYTKKEAQKWTKATTTPLVRKTFEMFFSGQLDKCNEKNLVLRRKRCGICDNCQKSDCGQCNACQDMAKFGGSGKTKKACIHRNCPNMAVEQAEQDSDQEEEEDGDPKDIVSVEFAENKVPVNLKNAGMKNITWTSDVVKTEGDRVFYKAVKIDNLEVNLGDFVMVDTSSPTIPHLIVRIVYMWKENLTPKLGYFHGQVFARASETVLGEVSDPREVFLQDNCCNKAPLSSVLRLASVNKRELAKNWFESGGEDMIEDMLEDNGKTYFYQKYYDKIHGRFEDLPLDPMCPNPAREHRFCVSCERHNKKYAYYIPKVIEKVENNQEHLKEINRYEWGAVKWKDFEYRKGTGVFIQPGTFKLKNYQEIRERSKIEKVDETIYTEYYRKSESNMRGSNVDTVEPYCVGYINAVLARTNDAIVKPQDILLKVNVMYRPENTKKNNPHHDDLNMVYWSNEEKEIPFSSVVDPCHIVYFENISNDSISDWSKQEYSRFYFKEAYDKTNDKFDDVPTHAISIGVDKTKNKGKGKGKSNKSDKKTDGPDLTQIKPMKMLDVFAGCGGLSDGLHRSGAAVSCWAIEQVTKAARAYQLNNPSCAVFTDDCNKLLRLVLDGETHTVSGQKLPARGEVELLCGGPPCQGFSGMNRFNSREYSNFKNSLIASFLSYCDYYRPKYFIMENVRNFVAFKKGMVLKLTLRCLLQIGYQCTFGIVQAGNYGVPQTRRRLIIFAAAPGYPLPKYPVPTHVFTRRACTLNIAVDGKQYKTNLAWYNSAPRRTCTIRDAMSDLPEIPNGAIRLEIEYGSSPKSDFQRQIRTKDESVKLRDHICKNMAPLIHARICRIPTTPGSDWRDLPNISVTLSDGTKSKVLQYWYNDIKNGRGPGGRLRGVCSCAKGGPCNSTDKQDNTLIPWCLPHTGNRHNNWAGLYGRVSWDGYFSTTVTDPEPMGKQGRILHPEQNRVVSVRECARSQGFPDSYIFVGSTQDKHRQIGNAVPPPLGAALGRELKYALASKI